MEAGEVGEWTDNDRTQCNFKFNHKFFSQDAHSRNKIKTKTASQGIWEKKRSLILQSAHEHTP